MEIEALLIGNWKSIAELEECLTLAELEGVILKSREIRHQDALWLARVNGIEIKDNPDKETPEEIVERLKRKQQAKEEGKTEEQFEFDEIGLDIEIEE